MGVYIKGMDENPEDGAVLVVMHDNGKAYIKHACTYGYSMELVNVPEPHGRLIDADKFNEFIEKHCADNLADLWKELVRRQPTVIGAEGE